MIKRLLFFIIGFFLFVIIFPWYEVQFYNSHWEEKKSGDCVMILGSKVLSDNTPNVMMQERVETALSIITPATKALITSGGSVDHKKSEAEVMKSMLIARGVSSEKIITEDKSTSTYENLAFSKPLITKAGCKKIDIVSHKFHLARVQMVADRLFIPIHRFIPAKQASTDTLDRLIREYKAYLWYWLGWKWIDKSPIIMMKNPNN